MSSEVQLRLLLAISRNIGEPSGEWRLISERALGLKSNSVHTDVLYMHNKRRPGFTPDLHGWAEGFSCISYGGAATIGIALARALISIRRWLRANPGGYIILSGVQMYPLVSLLPSHRIVLDLHGTLAEWHEAKQQTKQQRVLRRLYRVVSRLESFAIARSRGTLVVSAALLDYALKRGAAAAWLVPCVTSTTTASRLRKNPFPESKSTYSGPQVIDSTFGRG
jgi:hypothetical protein